MTTTAQPLLYAGHLEYALHLLVVDCSQKFVQSRYQDFLQHIVMGRYGDYNTRVGTALTVCTALTPLYARSLTCKDVDGRCVL